MQLFYNPNLSSESSTCDFDKTESGHLHKVLRKKEGDKLQVTNGEGKLFQVELTEVSKYKSVGKVLDFQQQKPKDHYLHLAVAPTKNNSRFENFLEKATEIGVDEITPVFCENSERKTIKYDRFLRILEAAMKQSLRWTLPKLNGACDIKPFLENSKADQKFIAHCEKRDRKSLKKLIGPQKETLILIGPEGDFSTEEIDSALNLDFIPVTLGEHRLRTETAAIVSCYTAALVNED
jgi:16S rRNA (uracil1498-N3)-methyltransferase